MGARRVCSMRDLHKGSAGGYIGAKFEGLGFRV